MLKSYATINNCEEERMDSASGGIISLLAKYIISKGGVVYGVENTIYNMNYVQIDDVSKLHRIRGSKYVKVSNFSWAVKQIKENITNNKLFMFVGTPCQIKAVRSLVNKEKYNNCLLVDLICHGVMDDKIYLKYIKWLESKYRSNVKYITFRDKKSGWKNQKWRITLESGNDVTPEDVEIIKKIYYTHYAHVSSCLKCPFTNMDRNGDITVGDLWGVEKSKDIPDDDKGINLVIINSEKGMYYIDSISDNMWTKEVNINDFMQPQLKENIKTNLKERNLFIKEIDKHSLKRTFDLMFNRKYKYRIIRNIKLMFVK